MTGPMPGSSLQPLGRERVEVGGGAQQPGAPAAPRPASRPCRPCPSTAAKALSSCQRRSGQSRLGQRVKTPRLIVGVSQTGQRAGGCSGGPRGPGSRRRAARARRPAGSRRRRAGRSPRRRSRMSLRARSSSLCSVAIFTVTPPTWTGSSAANGCRSPNLPTFHWISRTRGHRRRRRELPRDRPARVAARRRRAAAGARGRRPSRRRRRSRSPARRGAPASPRRPPTTSSSVVSSAMSGFTRKPWSRSQSSASECAREGQALRRPDAVAPHRERALGRQRGVELADRPRGRVARVHERRQPLPRRGAR